MPETASFIHTAPPDAGAPVLGKTLPDLLYEACARYVNPRALNQPVGEEWTAYSLQAFREGAEAVALGLEAAGLQRGDRVALYLHSDVNFCLADMGCLIAGLVDVPIYLTQSPEATGFVLGHAEAQAVVVSDRVLLARLAPLLAELPLLTLVVLAQPEAHPEAPMPTLPDHVTLRSLDELQAAGREALAADPEAVSARLEALSPGDLATLIYTSGTTGQPKGVMLSHENISSNAGTAFSILSGYDPGTEAEIALSFLPLTHVFARMLHYGYMANGTSVFFTTPEHLVRDLGRVRPTVFATVPRVLEKIYARIAEKAATLHGFKKRLLNWAIDLAKDYQVGRAPTGFYKAELAMADRLVFEKWRAIMGGRVDFIISGGAALSPSLANLFAAAGIPVYQGYGLTETSPVISYNRPGYNRPDSVGQPIPGVEVRIAEDGEILTRGPHVMLGYYKNPEKTAEVMTEDGWFCTGDIGAFTEDGYLRITDRKKDLFKLSTGKYVMPQPLENKLTSEPVVEQAVVVGVGQKYAAALIFPEQEALRSLAGAWGLDAEQPMADLLAEPKVHEHYAALVEQANAGMDHWSTIKRFKLIPEHLSIENGLLTPTLKVRRAQLNQQFADTVDALYD